MDLIQRPQSFDNIVMEQCVKVAQGDKVVHTEDRGIQRGGASRLCLVPDWREGSRTHY